MDLKALLLESKALDEGALGQARRMAEVMRLPLCLVLLRYGFLEPRRLVVLLGKGLELIPVDVDRVAVPPELVQAVPEELCLALRVMPIMLAQEGRELLVCLAMTDPTDTQAMRQIGRLMLKRARPLLAEDDALERTIRRHHAALRKGRGGGDDEIPAIIGQMLMKTELELRWEPEPFLAVSADDSHEFPGVSLDSFDALEPGDPVTDSPLAEVPVTVGEATRVYKRPAMPTELDVVPVTEVDVPRSALNAKETARFEVFTQRKACFVSDDPTTRKQVEREMKGLVDNMYTEVSLAHVLQLGVEIDDVVLFEPDFNERIHELLLKVAQAPRRPRIVVISNLAGFEKAPGVAQRIAPPAESEALPAVVLHALLGAR